jgi:F0F1-type ATP synthase epsilon subunit
LPSCRCARDLGVQAPRVTLLTGRALRSTEVDLHASRRRHRSAEQLNQQAQDRCGHPVAAVSARLLRCRSRRWRS